MFRFALQRYGTWRWLDYEAAIVTNDGPEWCLSGYGVMKAEIPAPAAWRLVGDDGRPMFEPWSTIVHAEVGERDRRWTGIVSEAELGRSGWELTIVEHPGYLHGIPYLGMVRGIQADPAALIRQLVDDTQAWPGGWYGCSVDGATPVRVGTDLDDRVAAARATMDARKKTLDAFSKSARAQSKSVQDLDSTLADEVAEARALVAQAQQYVVSLINSDAEAGQINTARGVVAARQATYNATLAAYNSEIAAGRAALANARADRESAQAAYDAAKKAYDALKERRKNEGGAYEVRGEDLIDTYKALQDIATGAGLEWSTRTSYREGAPDVGIVVHYPRAGRRRDDLVFDTSVNIIGVLELEAGDYANVAVGVGAGEGATALRRIISLPSDRMRRPVDVEDRAITSAAVMDARLRAVLRASTGALFPTEIEVRDHPNCPIGAWQVGDIITISGATTVGTHWDGLARIESWSWPSPYRAKLHLAPA